MELSPRKKLCVYLPHQEEVVRPNEEPANKCGEPRASMRMRDIPQDDLIGIFTYCPLHIRCRVRRVSHYWKHVVGLPEVNETVLVNQRCLLVSAENDPSSSSKEAAQPKITLCKGWRSPYNPAGYSVTAGNLSDHRRHGLLGPHVRTMIYDAADTYERLGSGIYEVQGIVRSIGLYCTEVQHIILWRLHWHLCGVFTLPRKAQFMPDLPQQQQPSRLTVLESFCRMGDFTRRHYSEPDDAAVVSAHVVLVGHKGVCTVAVPLWEVDGSQSDQEFVRRFFPVCTADQRAWVARYAPRLPESYHAVVREGLGFSSWLPGLRKELSLDLVTGDYAQADAFLVRALAHCILHEKVNMEPPPKSFR